MFQDLDLAVKILLWSNSFEAHFDAIFFPFLKTRLSYSIMHCSYTELSSGRAIRDNVIVIYSVDIKNY